MKKMSAATIAADGVKDSEAFARLMSAVMSDVAKGSLVPALANAIVNAGGKLLKVFELEQRYGSKDAAGRKSITFVED
jgi:hypothetical protein